MKLNFDSPLLDIKGTPLQDSEGAEAIAQTLVVNALLSDFPDEKVTGEDKFRRFKLAVAISGSPEQDLKVEDVTLIKKVVGMAFTPLVVGRLYDMLDA